MTVLCDISACPFCDKNGFCTNRVLKINQQGLCKRLTKPNWQQPVQDFEREPINLITLAKREEPTEEVIDKKE